MRVNELPERKRTDNDQSGDTGPYVIWLKRDLKIASVHEEPDYEKIEFSKHGEYMEYLQGLSNQHFKFK